MSESTPQIIQLMYGSQTFKTASNKVNTFCLKTDMSGKRVFPNKELAQVAGGFSKIPAAKNGNKYNGYWMATSYYAVEGTVLMVQASTSYRGARYNDGRCILLVRERAPLVQIEVSLRSASSAVYQGIPAFIGRADTLSVDSLEDHGVRMNSREINTYFDEEELEEIFTIQTLAPGEEAPEMLTIKTPSGSVKKVQASQEPTRKLRIRRK